MVVGVNAWRIQRLLPTPGASATIPDLHLGIGNMGEGGGDIPVPGAATAVPSDRSARPDVFISYASPDIAVADAVCAALEREAVNCWIAPRDVLPGDFYADSIVRAIDASRAIIIVLSQSAVVSPHVLREVERATSKRHPVLTLRIDQVPLPAALEYFLNTSQWLDVSSEGLASALPRLLTAVRRVIAGAPADHASTGALAAAPDVRGPAHKAASQPVNRVTLTLAALVLLAIVLFVADRFWLSARRPEPVPATATMTSSTPASVAAIPAVSDKSIAVLPFVDMSEKKDQEYFSDGLSEELIDLLAHSADLKVIARTSSFQFKGKNEDMRTIGQRLGVSNLLEGSVRTSGKTVRVTAQLIRVSDGSHRWSQSYDRDMRDIFKVQDAIAAAVVTALEATMAGGTQPPEAIPANTEAYKAVLRGRFFRQKETQEDSERSVAAFQEALRLDPGYALAFAELAGEYNERGLDGWMLPKEAYAKAKEAADRAVKIDPQLARAHRVLAAIEWNYARNFALARSEEKRADELDPSNPSSIRAAGLDALARGEPNEAADILGSLAERDPLDASAREFAGWALFWADRLPQAEAAFRTLLELNPAFAGGHCELGAVLVAQDKPDAALAISRAETDEAARTLCTGDVLWVLGQRPEANALLTEAQTRYGNSHAYSIAGSYALRGDKDEAFKWLDRALENGEAQPSLMRSDRSLRNLRADPRFDALLGKMNLL
jgi:TolB-like protein/tetratricopeptide (TPR) repeat protein